MDVTDQGISDPIIVVVKLQAYENVVTHWRIKLAETGANRGEGSDMLICNKPNI